jgi:4-hydroxy-2-oxoheptanedioate aldolase
MKVDGPAWEGNRVRRNRLRELLDLGRPLVGSFVTFASPSLVEFCGLAGIDYIHLDGEHDGHGVETCYELVRAADAVGMASIVRVPVNRPEVVLAYAETGVNGIVAPHISSRGAASELVAALRYPPMGSRGAGSGTRAANYGLTQTPTEYFTAEEEHTFAIALLEDVEAFDHIDEIVDVEGIDIVSIGPADLAASLGLPGQQAHSSVVERIKSAVPRIRDCGVKVMMTGVTAAAAREALALGADMVQTSNGALMRQAIEAYLQGAAGA